MNRTACPQCQSVGKDTTGDNLVDYGTHKHCYACGYHEGDRTSSKETRKVRRMPNLVPVTKFPGRAYLSQIASSWGCLAEPIKTRGGSTYGTKHSPTIVFPYFSGTTLTGLKGRNFEKSKAVATFWYEGFKDYTVFGLHMVKGYKTVVLVEGEPDTLCLAMVFKANNIEADVLGISGTGNVKKLLDVAKFLKSYSEIYIAFDADEEGELAASKAVEILPEYKCRMVSWSRKDPCDVYEHSGPDKILDCLEAAEPLTSTDLVTGDQIGRLYLSHLEHGQLSGFTSTYPSLDAMLGGSLKRGEALIFSAHTGHGKSTFVLNWAYSIAANNDTRVLWVGTEMLWEQMVHKLAELDLESPVVYRDGILQDIKHEKFMDSISWIQDKFLFYDGGMEIDAILDAAEAAIYTHNVGVVVIDVLDDVLSEDWKVARPQIKAIKDFTLGSPKDKRPAVAAIMVAHTKQRDGKYSKTIRLDDISGGVGHIRQATAVIGMDGEIGEYDRELTLLKLPRMGESLGRHCSLTYLQSQRHYEETE